MVKVGGGSAATQPERLNVSMMSVQSQVNSDRTKLLFLHVSASKVHKGNVSYG